MIKKIVAIAIVSMFIMCGISFADGESSIVEPGSGIDGQLDRLTQESAYVSGVLVKPHDDKTLDTAPANEVTESLIERGVIPEAEAQRLGTN
ncbi:MAG TPA: hypothetical protein VMW01_04080 [Williamwhitmania sp.]|nr:hypothetical protein [Williamwhitmania sp.]